MGNDDEVVKKIEPLVEKSSEEEEIKGFDEIRVLKIDGENDDFDVNMPVKEGILVKNIDVRVEVDCIETGSKEGDFGGDGEIEGVNGDVGVTQVAELVNDEGSNGNSEFGGGGEISTPAPLPRKRGRKPKVQSGGSSNSELKGETGKRSGDLSNGISQRTRNRVVKGKKEDVEDMDDVKMMNVDGEGDVESGFSVGDFVWGKIKSHPWWPGRVYCPSSASEFALKYKYEGRLLVAYFGDGTFAWCDSSQLKPFEENFEEMSKQSGLKSFVSAVGEAVEEFGRLVEEKMTCFCARKESQSSLSFVVNAGIKEKVCVPLDGVEKFSADKFEPNVILDDIKSFAMFDSVTNLLELRVLKSLISVYYHSKGVYLLPTYYEPVGIEELVHLDSVPKEGSAQGPDDEDWLIGPGDLLLMKNGQEASSDLSHKKRKVKTMVEILGIDAQIEFEENCVDGSKGKLQPRELASNSGKKRQKRPKLDDDETGTTTEEDGVSGNLALKSNRRKKTIDESPTFSAENSRITRSTGRKIEGPETEKVATSKKRGPKLKEDFNGEKEQTETGNVVSPSHKKMKMNLRIDTVLASEEAQERMSPRERKKSKYLSPPYLSPLHEKQRCPGFRIGSDSRGLEIFDVGKVGEKMSKAAVKLVGSPPTGKCSAETFERSSKRVGSSLKKMRTENSDHKASKLKSNVVDSMKSIESSNSVLCEIRSVALDPGYSKSKHKSFDPVKGFLCSYRSANYKDGSNYHSFKKQMADQRKRKRNKSETNNGSDVNGLSQPKTPKRSTTKKKEPRSDSKADPTSSAVLVMRFPPEFTLPSKEDLLKIHSKFGPLDESKSKVMPKSSTAKMVFVKSSDAEAAKNSLEQDNPFGTDKVSYKVKHLQATSSKTQKPKSQNKKKSELSETQKQKSSDKPPPVASENEPLSVVFIKQKLEDMTSMVGKGNGKMTEKMRANLEIEVKELLKKVKMMTASSS